MNASDVPGGSTRDVTRRDLSVARVVDPARERAEARVQQFLDAALELVNGPSGKDFKLQEVVERSGLSLRSFYQYFNGKHELLLALLEDSIRRTADQLRARVEPEDDPLERLHRLVVDYYVLSRSGAAAASGAQSRTPALAEFAQQLLSDHPQEASRAFLPMLALIEEVLQEAAAAGAIRGELRPRRVAGFLMHAVIFNAFVASTMGGANRREVQTAGEEVWDLLFRGLHGPAAG